MIELNKIYHGKHQEILRDFPDNFFDSCVADPPYGISFMNQHWDYDVPTVKDWKGILRVMKPGAHLLCACGTRTQHRMVVNIEDAGFEIRDVITWHYGSGFPKSLDISKQLDKAKRGEIVRDKLIYFSKERGVDGKWLEEVAGVASAASFRDWTIGGHAPSDENWNKIKSALDITKEEEDRFEREVVGTRKSNGIDAHKWLGEKYEEHQSNEIDITAPATEEAKQWEGYGTALKPATEFWTLARKPLSENTVAANVLKWGTGGINIDGCRIDLNDYDINEYIPNRCGWKDGINYKQTTTNKGYLGTNTFKQVAGKQQQVINPQGRFPANVIFDEFTGKILDEQSGESFSSGGTGEASKVSNGSINWKPSNTGGFYDVGGASRFFYCPKADNYERNKGLEKFIPIKVNDGRETEIDNAFQRGETLRKNTHPTVKPIDLMRYLVKLITPKKGICLDPYCGSGTTLIGCKLELINYIGIDTVENHCRIAEARVAAWNPDKYKAQTLF